MKNTAVKQIGSLRIIFQTVQESEEATEVTVLKN